MWCSVLRWTPFVLMTSYGLAPAFVRTFVMGHGGHVKLIMLMLIHVRPTVSWGSHSSSSTHRLWLMIIYHEKLGDCLLSFGQCMVDTPYSFLDENCIASLQPHSQETVSLSKCWCCQKASLETCSTIWVEAQRRKKKKPFRRLVRSWLHAIPEILRIE